MAPDDERVLVARLRAGDTGAFDEVYEAYRPRVFAFLLRMTRNRALAVRGTVKTAGNQVTFRDLSGAFACKGAQASGRYAWKIQGTKLTFTRLADKCLGRRTLLTATYTRVR